MKKIFASILVCLALAISGRAFSQTAPVWPPAPDNAIGIPDATHPASAIVPVAPIADVIPSPRFNVRAYGAKGDGVTMDTTAIQKAIDSAKGTGGCVYLSGGKFLTAPLTLKAQTTFYIASDATLLGSTNPTDYPDQMPRQTAATDLRKSLLFADGADDLSIIGGGTIDGQGQKLNMGGKEPLRPSLIRIFSSRRVLIRNVTFQNPRMWTQIYSECDGVTLDNVKVISPRGYCQNLDGMDICDCSHVVVRNCNIKAQDDGICLKTHGQKGLQDVLVENNEITDYDANGIKLGTASHGPVNGIRIFNNVIHSAKYGGLCIESVDGGQVNDVVVKALDMENVAEPIYVRLSLRNWKPGDTRQPGWMQRILIEGIRAIHPRKDGKPIPSNTITGVPFARIENLILRKAYIEMPGGLAKVPPIPAEHEAEYPQSDELKDVPALGFYVRHADGVFFEDVTIVPVKPDIRPWMSQDDSQVNADRCGLGHNK